MQSRGEMSSFLGDIFEPMARDFSDFFARAVDEKKEGMVGAKLRPASQVKRGETDSRRDYDPAKTDDWQAGRHHRNLDRSRSVGRVGNGTTSTENGPCESVEC
jgi:hypothetical protein